MATKKTPAKRATPAASKGWALAVPAVGDADAFVAQAAADGVVGNARSLVGFGHGTFGELSLTECAKALRGAADGFNDGDLSGAVTMLSAQAAALNAMFGELARRAAMNMGEYLDASDRYMRLALKAQGQCRATLETLAAIKNPPVVFARQANINNGGQQQVNNGAAPASRAGEPQSAPSELLEQRHEQQWMDPGAQSTAGGADPHLAPVGAVNRPAHR